MNLTYESCTALPKLAWIASIEDQNATITHGPWVETFDQGFIEGIWDGSFDDAAFDQSPTVFGTGAVLRGDSLIFVSSSSTTDAIFWTHRNEGRFIAVANSLPLLLASLKDELDPQFMGYDLINASIMSGIKNYIESIPTRNGHVNRLMHWNLCVARGKFHKIDKILPPHFADFGDYADYLSVVYRRLAMNAKDTRRRYPMQIFSTQSKGYDSTAANSIAREQGIDLVFTVTKGKASGYFAGEDLSIEPDDDGTTICNILGLKCIPIKRRAIESDLGAEYLYYACMHETGDFNLHGINRSVVQPSILITGCLGEIWSRRSYYDIRPGIINSELTRGDLGNHALGEIRLQSGYIQLAFPYIGARRRRDIFRITESDELTPWRLGSEYDRPVPRRIAEQAGVPREIFGQVKMASVLEYPRPIFPIGLALREEYFVFLSNNNILHRRLAILVSLVRWWNAVTWTASSRRHRSVYILQRAASKILGRTFEFPQIWKRLNGSIFCFCVNKRITDYHAARNESGLP